VICLEAAGDICVRAADLRAGWLAATDHWASPSSPGLACCQAARAHAPVTLAAGGSRSRLCWATVA